MDHYYSMKRAELKDLAESRGLKKAYTFRKDALIGWLEAQDARETNESLSGEKASAVSKSAATPSKSDKAGAKKSAVSSKGDKAEAKKTVAKKGRAKAKKTSASAKNKPTSDNATSQKETSDDSLPGNAASDEMFCVEETAGAEPACDETNDTASDTAKKARRDLPSDSGVLEVMSDGYGFLRGEKEDGTRTDYYVPAIQIKRFNLKSGDIVEGIVGDAHDKDKYAPIIYINAINGTSPTSYVRRMEFDDLTPIYPDERLRLETVPEGISNRIVDLVAPVGRGQRGLIVSPPKAGKTTLLKSIAQAIELTYPEVYLFILLIDERPEEVTDFENSVNRMRKNDDSIRTEVVASTFDKQAQNHTRTAEELLERAKRLVESGQDVMILLDSLTRLSRAYNITTSPSGRTLSGGLDPVALYPPKKFFGAARNIRDAGSLTILATCLKDTGSRMDDMIYEEFKGTGNMEVHLSRNLSEMRIFPAIDIFSSGTRRDDLLLTKEEQNAMLEVRKQGRNADETAVMEQFVRLMKNTENNQEFCRVILGNSAAAGEARRRVSPATRRFAQREAISLSRAKTATERSEE